MEGNRYKEKNMFEPIEKHDTAAWDNIKETKPVSNVIIPDEQGVIGARKWVEENQK